MARIEIFISHSSRDEELAKRLITLIRCALVIPSELIRCTSLDGFRLPVGVTTDEALRRDILESIAFIAIITPSAVESTYVLFELGARWGAQKALIPLLGNGVISAVLLGPMATLNALSCDNPAQMHQFIENLATELHTKAGPAAAFSDCVDEVVRTSKAGGRTYREETLHTVYTISFEYLPKTPLAPTQWLRAPGYEGIGVFNADSDIPDSLRMTVEGRFAMDYRVPQFAKLLNRLQFTAKLLDGAVFYTQVVLLTRDRSDTETWWLAHVIGAKRPAKVSDNEWTFYLPITDGRFVISLAKEVREVFEPYGLIFGELKTIRLRGNLSISPIRISYEVPATA